ncbi:MAG: hypothetical protein NVSMB66_6550 [Candidatus Doudnabacteria bacterium]
MRANLIKQFNCIRDTILQNAETIKAMVTQVEDLSKLAESLPAAATGTDDTKTKLQTQINFMNKSISSLIEQTTELFKLYEKFAEELFSA